MRPDLLIVGDSHTAALYEAARARGYDARILYISGNHWHENQMRPHGRQGLAAGYRPRLNRAISRFAEEAGGSVFPADVPVLASFGYHLGRLAPLFARRGHTPDADQAEETQGLFTSDAFLHAYVQAHRGMLWRILRLAAQRADLVVVAPPMLGVDPVSMRIAALITDHLTGLGLRVFDPRREPDWAGSPLPADLRTPDNTHGNAAYGGMVLARLADRGWLAQPAPRMESVDP